jgi:GDP-6-deoxy-D-talose 4-dehydrogenase
MKVLVTGIDGFTGQYLKEELITHGHEALGLRSDLLDLPALTQELRDTEPHAVIHLAGISFVQHQNIQDIYTVNLIGAYNLLWALHQSACPLNCIILPSSGTVYGNIEGALSESLSFNPINDYAVSKLAMEYMAKLWFDRLPIVMVRPFNYTGVGQKDNFLIPKIVAHFKRKAPVIELGNTQVWREFGDVRSVCTIYRQLLEKPPLYQTLNLCTGQAHSLQEVIDLCQKITGHTLEVKVNPAFVRPNEIRELKGDPTLLHQYVSPDSSYTLEETLRWMLHF